MMKISLLTKLTGILNFYQEILQNLILKENFCKIDRRDKFY